MKRLIRFNQGIIGGDDKENIVEILPQLKNSFKQRKTYHEYYFTDTEVELSLAEIERISRNFVVLLDYEELTLKL